jgi:Amt family ammonium transporter
MSWSRMMRLVVPCLVFSFAVGGMVPAPPSILPPASVAVAADEEPATEEAAAEESNPPGWNDGDPVAELSYDDGNDYAINTLIMFICAVLVIFMQAGFAMVEIGLNSAKNVVNILSKNVMDFCVGVLLFLFVGYSLMYPSEWISGIAQLLHQPGCPG